ncbi:MAG: ATP-binding protein [Gemmatimonadetes bacterium]|nr:ATP-binding protein [Gemmatimonadota bacterium]
MSLPVVANPFVPGRGQMPPYLAGREEEKRTLIELLAYLKARRGAPCDAVLSGPRGNGKTALLRWLCREAEADGTIDSVWLTPCEVTSLDELATALAPPGRCGSLRPDDVPVQVTAGDFGWKLDGQPGALRPLLKARCLRRPLVAVLDECHTLNAEIGQVLLNVSQSVCAEAPFLLVMAGTPGLQRHLNTMSATFWSRAEKIGIGRLDDQATAAALERPLAAEKPPIACSTEALADAVTASQGYPYFVQLWGAALWQAACDLGTIEVGQSMVAAAAPTVGRSQSAYHQDRYQELERDNLLAVAARVAVAFAGQTTLPRTTLNAAIADALPDGQDSAADVLRCRDNLADLATSGNRRTPTTYGSPVCRA